MKPVNVVTFKWSNPGFRSEFKSEHVNSLARQVERHYKHPHTFHCVTDDPTGLDSNIKYVPIWDDYNYLRNPTWQAGPSCYRRLKVFDTDQFGERFVCLDLDTVVVGDLAPLWHREEECVTYRPKALRGAINGAMFLQTAKSRKHVWQLFDPNTSPQICQKLGYVGSDQAWMTAALQWCSGAWDHRDGIYEYKFLGTARPQQRATKFKRRTVKREPPKDARLVFFHGKPDPWECDDEWILDSI